MRTPYRKQDPKRRASPGAARGGGWMQLLSQEWLKLQRALKSLEMRNEEFGIDDEPACGSGQMVFTPDLTTSFLLDRQQAGAAAIASQYVVRDAITYTIPIVFPPPGLLEARFLHVAITQRLFHPTEGVQQIRMPMNPAMSYASVAAGNGGVQTVKYSYAPNRFIQFFWNLIDMKSGVQLSDNLLPDALLLPAMSAARAVSSNMGDADMGFWDSGDVGLELDVPWLFERDAQIAFLFRPITAVVQPAADSGFSPYAFDDREVNGTVRNSAVTVEVELHGGRIYTEEDEQRMGARVDRERFHHGGFG